MEICFMGPGIAVLCDKCHMDISASIDKIVRAIK